MHDKHKPRSMTRRQFIGATAGSLTASAMLSACVRSPEARIMTPTAAQRAQKKAGDSTVSILQCESYDEDIFAMLKPLLKAADLPDLKGKLVLIKPNMIDVVPGRPITTHPSMIAAAAQLADYLGAREIIVGEGPGHNRDTQFLLDGSGQGAVIRKLGLKFVDLNLDDLEKIDVPEPFSGLKHIYFPKAVMEADAIISLPKLKTHHWARLTASMKNLYGCIPGRKYGWPKNVLHWHGIDNCILDINRVLRPPIQLVDGIVAMEGDGPIMGSAKQAHVVLLGNDAVATDATCARIMGIDVHNVPYLRVAGEVLGNNHAEHIRINGAQIAAVASDFRPAPCFDKKGKAIRLDDPNSSPS